ncbi:MAG: DUF2846 domain-containing protein [Candidatus Sulfotelmatobacter sp.]
MKTALALILFVGCACAQEQGALGQSMAACGSSNIQFAAKTSTSQPVSQPEPNKALIYLIEDFPGKILGINPTIRFGMDGAWLGATRSDSYFWQAIEPGEHHLCVNWQSSLGRFSKLAAFAGFTAEAGKVYYFRAHIIASGFGGRNGNAMDLDLDLLNPDEGRFLAASYEWSTSHPKK